MAKFKPLLPFGEQHEALNNHPITPPPELLQRLRKEAPIYRDCGVRREEWIATQSSRWGWEQRGADIEAKLQKARDEELEACCEEMKSIPSPLGIPFGEMASNALRNARRPKTKSLAEEALEALDRMDQLPTAEDQSVIRSALKRLQELEEQVDG